MDPVRFDLLTRSLTVPSRRQFLSIATAVALALAGGNEAEGKKSKKCRRGKKKCRGKCIRKSRCCRDNDCQRGELCAAGTCVVGAAECPAGADSCATTTITCAEDDQCACHQRLEGGVRCVQFTLNQGECDQCATDADCRKLGFPPGSSCIKDDGAECSCEADDRGFCGEPCGFVGPDTGIKRSATRGPR